MRIVIDIQSAQSPVRLCSIGRYILSLTKEIVLKRGTHDIVLALSSLDPELIKTIRIAFRSILPRDSIRVWTTPDYIDIRNKGHRDTVELLREQFLASLSPDIVLLGTLSATSVNAISSIGSLSHNMTTAVIVYDLISILPYKYINKSYCINNTTESDESLSQLIDTLVDSQAHLKRADLLLTTSNTLYQTIGNHRDFSNHRIGAIPTAAANEFSSSIVTDIEISQLASSYGLAKPFIMYMGCIIKPHEQIEQLFNAYSMLPMTVKQSHQLLVMCPTEHIHRKKLYQMASKHDLDEGCLIVIENPSNSDLLQLYRACKLFIQSSWDDSFALPALEAMQCGKAVIASHQANLHEFLGRDDILFNPSDIHSLANLIRKVVDNEKFRAELEQHGLVQANKYSLSTAAEITLQSLEATVRSQKKHVYPGANRPRLAFVAPLQPLQTGIADYCAELLPFLSTYYRIEVVVAQKEVSDQWVLDHCLIRHVDWFKKNGHEFDRVIYHIGNSLYHSHMNDLLKDHPGVVVTHDLCLGDLMNYHVTNSGTGDLYKTLVSSYGWTALKSFLEDADKGRWVSLRDFSLQILQHATGIIAHNNYPRQLIRHIYGEQQTNNWRTIPLLRVSAENYPKSDRLSARKALGISDDDFVACSFGFLGKIKLNHRTLACWQKSSLAKNTKCHLIFVGKLGHDEYGISIRHNINNGPGSDNIKITGYVDINTYHHWLAAADIGIQLRNESRGESSASILDCMNFGLPTIVNAHGSAKELDNDAVFHLSDEFDDEDLINAISTLWQDDDIRRNIGSKAQKVIAENHNPKYCAELYAKAIEHFSKHSGFGTHDLLSAITAQQSQLVKSNWPDLARSISKNNTPYPRRRQLLLDVTCICMHDNKTGIERVVRSILHQWLHNPPPHIQVEPVYLDRQHNIFRYARCYTSKLIGIQNVFDHSEPVEVYHNDIFLGLDLNLYLTQTDILTEWYQRGVTIQFIVYDLLPILRPDVFPESMFSNFKKWLRGVAQFDTAICISQSVAHDLNSWLVNNSPNGQSPSVRWFHLGADIDKSDPSCGLPRNAHSILKKLSEKINFLIVGTIEPRKGHAQVLTAFESLWKQNHDINLIFVGKQGWEKDHLIRKIQNHHQLNKRLFWLEAISDEYLEKIYEVSSCLIASSEGEGFGLPLIEAAQHRLPLIVRETPVFREVAGEYAYYFEDSEDPNIIAKAISEWLKLYYDEKHPQSNNITWLTWEQSARQLIDIVVNNPTEEKVTYMEKI